MLKREPSKLVIEGINFIYLGCIVSYRITVLLWILNLESYSLKLYVQTYKTLVEDDYLDIYLNKYPDFIHKEQSYYYREFNFQESEFNIEGETLRSLMETFELVIYQ